MLSPLLHTPHEKDVPYPDTLDMEPKVSHMLEKCSLYHLSCTTSPSVKETV